MDELNKALSEISDIRRQMAHTTEFRGYGPQTLAATGIFAVLAALGQALWLPDPAGHLGAYLGIWITTAIASAALIAIQTVNRAQRIHSGLADEMIHQAVEQFLPSFGAGALLTLVLARSVPSVAWMLPGLWQMVFSLGVFASCRFLPRPMIAAGAWYLLAGLTTIALADDRALSPWTMGTSFGVGQMLVAGVLYRNRGEVQDD
jgi:hypothetical protein